MKAKRIIRFGLYSAAAAVMLTQSCFAYLDPATTSYLLAIISGVVVAVGTTFGILFNKIKRKFKKNDEPEEISQESGYEYSAGQGVVLSAADLFDDDDEDEYENETVPAASRTETKSAYSEKISGAVNTKVQKRNIENEDIAELKEQIKEEVKNELKDELLKELLKEVFKGTIKDTITELKADIKEELKNEIKE